jgi:hypothetical protein
VLAEQLLLLLAAMAVIQLLAYYLRLKAAVVVAVDKTPTLKAEAAEVAEEVVVMELLLVEAVALGKQD